MFFQNSIITDEHTSSLTVYRRSSIFGVWRTNDSWRWAWFIVKYS